MLHRPLIVLLCALLLPALGLPRQEGEDPSARVHSAYVTAAAAHDEEQLIALWRKHPDLVLVTIDRDVEGSLAMVEAAARSNAEVDEDALAALHERAAFGALCAERATGHPILVDYVASFRSWNLAERTAFRSGQAAHGKAREALRAGEFAQAQAAARECFELAAPLGDWWGSAMGLATLGEAQAAAGDHTSAISSLGRARLLYHDLGLAGAEMRVLTHLASSLQAKDRPERETEVVRNALDLAERLGATELAKELTARARELAKSR